MLNSVIAVVARLTVGRKILDAMAAANQALSGHRTEILIGLEAAILALKKLGLIPAAAGPAVEALLTGINGALPITVVEKITKARSMADKVAPDQPAK